MKLLLTTAVFFFFGAAIFFALRPQTKEVVNPVTQSAPAPTSTPAPTPVPEAPNPKPVVKLPLNVPFTVQAPFAQWSDPRQQDACEEAAVLMAMKWVKSEKIGSPAAALAEILAMSHWQEDKYGDYHDTSATDTVKRLFNDYYGYTKAEVKPVTAPGDISHELEQGHLVITPMNGQALNNPHFTQPGPERHNIVVIGFDQKTDEFITNDPGIREGKNYRYPQDVFFNAIRDYPTGNHVPIKSAEKRMIVVTKT